ncbi:fibroblast growth factor receptor homolog 1-like isoform X2 [Dysidea avara]|uniref:fibroblast growth factor receptor homolog 1-like isoform X2 n=1 Tax=Dysidea avara TaxID=196820 RepID=UPI0033188CAD
MKGLKITIFGIVTAVGEPSFTASHHEIQADIFATICSFALCSSEDYYSVFRERDGSPANATTQLIPNINLEEAHDIECDTHCPLNDNTSVLWCIHLLTIKYEVRLCLNETDQFLSSAASVIRFNNRLDIDLGYYFSVSNTTLHVEQVSILLKHAYAGCMVNSGSCESAAYYSIGVGNSAGSETHLTSISEFPIAGGDLTLFLGDSVNLTCSGVIARGLTQLFWFYDSGAAVCPVRENPFCVSYNITSCQTSGPVLRNCPIDVRGGRRCKPSRVHSYNYNTVENCIYGFLKSTAMMRIDNVTWSDGGAYTCRPTTGNVMRTMNVTIEMKPIFISFPTNISQVINEGSSNMYNCTVTSSNRTTVQWLFKGVAVPECDDNNTMFQNICDVTNQKMICTTRNISMAENFILVSSLNLHICNMTVKSSGEYTCVVQGIDNRVIYQNKLTVKQTIEVSVKPTLGDIDNRDGASDVDNHDGASDVVVWIVSATAILIFVTSIFMIGVVTKLLCYMKKHQTVSMQINTNHYDIELAVPTTIKKDDEWEFPRENLKLLQKLDVGNFGQVLKAKAEGIVPDSPHINIVAVKQSKDAVESGDTFCSNLWHELEIMKKIEAHPNICNLLACCTKDGGPLCIVVEYAMYGKLKDCLLECKRVVTHSSHLPIHIANTTEPALHSRKRLLRTVQVQFSSTSSGYGSMIGKYSTESQGSIGSTSHSQESQDNLYSSSVETMATDGVFEITSDYRNVCSDETEDKFQPNTEFTCEYINSPGLIYEEDVINFALQIASGMEHLEKLKIVHRDVAARNILIAEDFCLKICDFGMAKDVQESECYRKLDEEIIPVKWTAIEALKDKIFTNKSDIWSYGIVLWEICSYGQSPFQGFNIEQDWQNFIEYLLQGNCLEKPAGCRDFLYDIMKECWNVNPNRRPNFSEIVTELKSFYCAELK